MFSEPKPNNFKDDVKDVADLKTSTLEEELKDTISVDVIADLFENVQPKSLNEKLSSNIQIGLNDRIAFVGQDASHTIGSKTVIFDLEEKYVTPGFADPHIHIDQFVLPSELAKKSLLCGWFCVVNYCKNFVYSMVTCICIICFQKNFFIKGFI